jgi:phosphoribosylamine---glycine ligase
MKVLFIDVDGTMLDLALRAQWAGHTVKMHIAHRKLHDIGERLVPRVNEWQAWMKWAELIVIPFNHTYAGELQWYYDNGYPILGTNPRAQQLEINREEGNKAFEHAGFDCLPFRKFEDYEEAITYVRKTKGNFVSKPLGDNANKALSYVSKGPEDMMFMLRKWQKKGYKFPFILQEKVEDGCEVGVSGWFGPHGWCSCWEEDFEHKKLMPGNMGPNTWEMGNAMKYVSESKLARDFLLPLTDTLHALKFVGNFAMGLMFDKKAKTMHPLECTIRCGIPAIYIQDSLHKGCMVDFFADLIHGKDTLRVRSDHAVGLTVAIPPWPYDDYVHDKEVEDYPIWGVTQGNMDDVHLAQAKCNEVECLESGAWKTRDTFCTAGPFVGCVVGRGVTVQKARERAYRLFDTLKIPNSPFCRDDIAERLPLEPLQKAGYCEEWIDGQAS